MTFLFITLNKDAVKCSVKQSLIRREVCERARNFGDLVIYTPRRENRMGLSAGHSTKLPEVNYANEGKIL